MAITALAVQTLTRTGSTPTYTSANADGHSVVNDGRVFLEFKNTDAAPVTVTFVTPGTVDTLAVADRTLVVEATTGNKMAGPFPTATYGTSMTVTFSAVTALTCAAFKIVS